MPRYSYQGAVMEFDRLVSNNWRGETVAPSEKKARNNLIFQYKKQYGKTAGSKITLPGKLTVVS